ncbi:hypothetical protein EV137_3387 [Kribbella pratensis]|uniref:Vitamin K epoxide reductase family protein n=1 Tax=Kribbella pratensis TaxID=2512112 RepID=A0ABY2FF73_9ACTN|nr:hypothetical protein [Kribbella pratensis]TDW89591.1 hypothetical protein EV137_3387 [Kribbella pratensis]
MEARTIGRVALQAVFVGVVAGVAYALMRQVGAPLCPPTGVSCAVESGGALFAVQLGGVATTLALPVLALRAGLGWVFAVAATAGVLVVNLVWFLSLSGMWTVLG